MYGICFLGSTVLNISSRSLFVFGSFFSADQPILMYIIDELILDQEVILINHSISIVFYGFTTVSAVQIRSQISRITNC